jgi:hypothetical protein
MILPSVSAPRLSPRPSTFRPLPHTFQSGEHATRYPTLHRTEEREATVTHLAALMIFAALSTIWFASVALYRSTTDGTDRPPRPATGPSRWSPSGRWP